MMEVVMVENSTGSMLVKELKLQLTNVGLCEG